MTNDPGAQDEQDDYDLLTYGEAGDRLATAVAAERAAIAALPETDPGRRRHVERLAALEQAQQRNRKQPLNDENFARFFGYPATPTR